MWVKSSKFVNDAQLTKGKSFILPKSQLGNMLSFTIMVNIQLLNNPADFYNQIQVQKEANMQENPGKSIGTGKK